MSRNKLYCEEAALQKATALFTRHGYNGTSLAMLTSELQIGKQSLYDCFGDKRQLLSSCLANAAQQFKPARHLLQTRLDARTTIERFFDDLVNECANPENPGCLVSNLLLEKGHSDNDIRDEAVGFWRVTQQALLQHCERGLLDGSINSDSSAAVLAASLMTWMSGLRISARAGNVQLMKKTNTAFLAALLAK